MRTSLIGFCALFVCAFGVEAAHAKPFVPIDSNPCVCDLLPARQFDVVIAFRQEVDGEQKYVVQDIVKHGLETRQVVGQPVVGADYFVGDTDATGQVLVYDKSDAQFRIFEVIQLPPGDWQDTTLAKFAPISISSGGFCPLTFTLYAFQQFLNAYSDPRTDCAGLADKHLGLPNIDADNGGCSGGASPNWLASILAALALLALRTRQWTAVERASRGTAHVLQTGARLPAASHSRRDQA